MSKVEIDRRYRQTHKDAIKAYNTQYRADHPTLNGESSKKWRINNPEYHRAKSKQWYAANKGWFKNRDLLRKYGITLEEYQDMVAMQDGKCAICKKATEILHVDHRHLPPDDWKHMLPADKKKYIRGLLCFNCNTGIGNLQDNIEIIESAAIYLRTGAR